MKILQPTDQPSVNIILSLLPKDFDEFDASSQPLGLRAIDSTEARECLQHLKDQGPILVQLEDVFEEMLPIGLRFTSTDLEESLTTFDLPCFLLVFRPHVLCLLPPDLFDADNAIQLCLDMRSVEHLKHIVSWSGGADLFASMMQLQHSWAPAIFEKVTDSVDEFDHVSMQLFEYIAVTLKHEATLQEYLESKGNAVIQFGALSI